MRATICKTHYSPTSSSPSSRLHCVAALAAGSAYRSSLSPSYQFNLRPLGRGQHHTRTAKLTCSPAFARTHVAQRLHRQMTMLPLTASCDMDTRSMLLYGCVTLVLLDTSSCEPLQKRTVACSRSQRSLLQAISQPLKGSNEVASPL